MSEKRCLHKKKQLKYELRGGVEFFYTLNGSVMVVWFFLHIWKRWFVIIFGVADQIYMTPPLPVLNDLSLTTWWRHLPSWVKGVSLFTRGVANMGGGVTNQTSPWLWDHKILPSSDGGGGGGTIHFRSMFSGYTLIKKVTDILHFPAHRCHIMSGVLAHANHVHTFYKSVFRS